MTLPIVFRREIGLYLPGVRVTTFGFPTLRSIIIRAFRNHYRKQPNIKLIIVIFTNIQYKGFPYILKTPIGNKLFLRAFYMFNFRKLFATSSLVTYYLIWIMPIQVSGLKSISLISYRSAYGQGKNLSISNIAFSPYVHIINVTPTFSARSNITTGSFGLQL